MESTKLPDTLAAMLSLSNSRAVYQNQARLARLKFDNSCIIGHAGGEFRITDAFIGYLQHRVSIGVDQAVLLDTNGMPILVADVEDFLDRVSSQYHSALNSFYEEIVRLRSTRKPEVMVEAS